MSGLQGVHFCSVEEAICEETKSIKKANKLKISNLPKLSLPDISNQKMTNLVIPFAETSSHPNNIKIRPPISPKPSMKAKGFFEKHEKVNIKKSSSHESLVIELRKIEQENKDAIERYISVRPIIPQRRHQQNPPPEPPKRTSSRDKKIKLMSRKTMSTPNMDDKNLEIIPDLDDQNYITMIGKSSFDSNRRDIIENSTNWKSQKYYELDNYDDFILTKDIKQTDHNSKIQHSKIFEEVSKNSYELENYDDFILTSAIKHTNNNSKNANFKITKKDSKNSYEIEESSNFYGIQEKLNLNESSKTGILSDEDFYTPIDQFDETAKLHFYHEIEELPHTTITSTKKPTTIPIKKYNTNVKDNKIYQVFNANIFEDISEGGALRQYADELRDKYNRKKK